MPSTASETRMSHSDFKALSITSGFLFRYTDSFTLPTKRVIKVPHLLVTSMELIAKVFLGDDLSKKKLDNNSNKSSSSKYYRKP